MGFCMALSMNSVGIPGGFRGNAGFSGKSGVWGGFGRFGRSKGFCANSQGKPPKKQGFLLSSEPLKFLGKKGNTTKKQGIPCKEKSKEIQKSKEKKIRVVLLGREGPPASLRAGNSRINLVRRRLLN